MFIKRLNRFLAEIAINSETSYAHVPNSARLLELLEYGVKLLVTRNRNCKSKTKYKIYAVKKHDILISIESILPNLVFKECIKLNLLPEFLGWEIRKNEYRYNDSRIDFLIYRNRDRKMSQTSSPLLDYEEQELRLVELKSCSLVMDGVALFPDSPTTRGLRHIKTLANSIKRGFDPYIIWIVQRNDAKYFTINSKIQPELEKFILETWVSGLRLHLLAFKIKVESNFIRIDERIPIIINGKRLDYFGWSNILANQQ
jgi:sugar fermentation stimulation protein A